jgi:hypothetical protein
METLYVHNGVAYLSKDLALINGADELSLYTLKLNETQSEDINIRVNIYEVCLEDDYENEVFFKTNKDIEYLAISNIHGITRKLQNRIESEIINFMDEFDFEY